MLLCVGFGINVFLDVSPIVEPNPNNSNIFVFLKLLHDIQTIRNYRPYP